MPQVVHNTSTSCRPAASSDRETSSLQIPVQSNILRLLRKEAPGRDTFASSLDDLNSQLAVLVEVFPGIQPEVFREMLSNLSQESRVEVVTESLLKDKNKWTKGRFRTNGTTNEHLPRRVQSKLAKCDQFRTLEYRQAVKSALYEEFRGLSHATIKAVLAEHNNSYTASRPILSQLADKSWRYYLTNFWTKRRGGVADHAVHPLISWKSDSISRVPDRRIPFLRPTPCHELNAEIYDNTIAPIMRQYEDDDIAFDYAYAQKLNEAEAEEAEAMFECECCYTSTTFEQIAACDSTGHALCFGCIQHAINEALFGQGWAKNIDQRKVSVRCLAPSADECTGCISAELAKRAICSDKDGEQKWQRLEDRIAADMLVKSGLPLLHCPFCSYAEVEYTVQLQFQTCLSFSEIVVKLTRLPLDSLLGAALAACVYGCAILLYPVAIFLVCILQLAYPSDFESSLRRAAWKRRGLRFVCRSPNCSRASCSLCFASWTDIHVCHESSTQSLRKAIEAATTAAVKRTCPKCNLSFVKSSGCNKLVCNCGYAMCYVCRNIIGKEGYGHFCQHFREQRGKCTECDRCDLYVVENEDIVVRRAAERAEREWREKEGGTDAGKNALLLQLEKRGNKPGAIAQEVITGRRREDMWTAETIIDILLRCLLA